MDKIKLDSDQKQNSNESSESYGDLEPNIDDVSKSFGLLGKNIYLNDDMFKSKSPKKEDKEEEKINKQIGKQLKSPINLKLNRLEES